MLLEIKRAVGRVFRTACNAIVAAKAPPTVLLHAAMCIVGGALAATACSHRQIATEAVPADRGYHHD
jgi:hypothetical protein